VINNNDIYTKGQIEKLGNAIIYLCEKLTPYNQASKTHILKLVFILEELSIKKNGLPFFGLRFDVWKLGPVSKDLYIELTEESNLLADFIEKEVKDGKTLIYPKRAFSDDEFSDHDILLLEEVSERFKYCTASELINFTHRKESPWFITAQRNGLVEILESGQINATDIEVDFTVLIANEKDKLAIYKGHQEFLHHTRSLKNL
jgi:uncharacterized phage-associated protein